ncbi:glycoprotein-N-acetylgalactosamine 3-beta-galactosyltransferase 1-like [Ornithodoros turicata]|uniref:glycoprotein-N-acetylgalactosamine 3-beta-galactosyltransferase 1-like n=1 Tax=Ornithodoros turicata TaxID=34597 RepID=UPI003138FCD2
MRMDNMPASRSVAVFLGASLSGILLGLLTLQSKKSDQRSHSPSVKNLQVESYDHWFSESGYERTDPNFGEKSEADFLFHRTPVICLIYAQSPQQVRSVASTWTRHCNHVIYFGTMKDAYVHIVPSDSPCQIIKFAWKRFGGKFKWVLIADDETFAVIENLRAYVAALNSSLVYYLGHPMQVSHGFYNVLNAGILLSEGSVLLLRGMSCKNLRGVTFDKTLGRLLKHLRPIDTRDAKNRGRFNPFSVEKMLIPGSVSYFNSYWRSSLFLSPEGGNCCSNRAITFHGINPVDMFLMEYLVQRVRRTSTHPTPTGVPPQKIPLDLRSFMNGKAFVKPFGISKVGQVDLL